MSLADFDTFTAAMNAANPALMVKTTSSTQGQTSGFQRRQPIGMSLWDVTGVPVPGTFPTTAAACDRTTVGGLGPAARATSMFLAGIQKLRGQVSASTYSRPVTNQVLLLDRLSHMGGLSANSTATQTTNLPTAALTRYTDGVGVYAFLEVTTAWGATVPSVVTVSYTNQAGTPGRTGRFTYDASISGDTNLVFQVGLEGADTGVRSVESVSLNVATGAGVFGVVLAKPLAYAVEHSTGSADATGIVGWNTPIDDDACLWPLVWHQASYTHAAMLAFGDLDYVVGS
jgi:hypothetical protein